MLSQGELGHGAMGIVYKAKSKTTGEEVKEQYSLYVGTFDYCNILVCLQNN